MTLPPPAPDREPVDHASSLARQLWTQADTEITATCTCPRDTEHHASKVRERYLELWRNR